jgi:glyoxylase-like metal-dependent hydrolase (beta-lactamase superfamily II)
MNTPTMFEGRAVAADTHILPAYLPVPGFGLLPINAFFIRAAQPVLVDTGVRAVGADFIRQLGRLIDLAALRWVWLTHTDPDHVGALDEILALAPHAQVVTTFIGMGKLALSRTLPPARVFLLNPGQSLDVGDRRLLALRPVTFDAPETTAFIDERTGVYFSADAFGAVLATPVDVAETVQDQQLRDGMVTWATVDSPWLSFVDRGVYERMLAELGRRAPRLVLSSHLPPAQDMLGTLLDHVRAACTAAPFEGPDQEALRKMLAA